MPITQIIITFLILINLTAITLTILDKRAAKRNTRRVRERTLLLSAVLGGSFAMLVTMTCIRHKTKHAKFMLGLRAIIILQIVVIAILWRQFG